MSEQAVRLPDNEDGIAGGADDSGQICYWWYENRWWLWLPGGGLADLSKHGVVEHEDGTISVVPSVLVTSPGRYHEGIPHVEGVSVNSGLGERHCNADDRECWSSAFNS